MASAARSSRPTSGRRCSRSSAASSPRTEAPPPTWSARSPPSTTRCGPRCSPSGRRPRTRRPPNWRRRASRTRAAPPPRRSSTPYASAPPEARRTVLEVSVVAWLELLEILAAPVAAAAKAAAAGDWSRLKCLSPSLYALPVAVLAKFAREQKELGRADGDMAMQRYYRLRVWCAAAAGKKDEAGAMLAKEVLKLGATAAAAAAAPPPAAPPPAASGSSAARGTPPTIIVSGAGCAEANGRYACAGYVPAGAAVGAPGGAALADPVPAAVGDELMWYIADKDQLNVNDGDLYRVRAVPIDEFMPPSTGWSLAKDGRPPMPSFEFVYDRPAPPPSPEQPRRSFFGQLFGRRQASSANAEASSSSSPEPPPSVKLVQQLIDMGRARDRARARAPPRRQRHGSRLNILLDPRLPPRRRRRRSRSRRRRRRRLAAVAKTAAVAADARGWARVADAARSRAAVGGRIRRGGRRDALLDQAAAAAATAAAPSGGTADTAADSDHRSGLLWFPARPREASVGERRSASGVRERHAEGPAEGPRIRQQKGAAVAPDAASGSVPARARAASVTENSEWRQLSIGVAEHALDTG